MKMKKRASLVVALAIVMILSTTVFAQETEKGLRLEGRVEGKNTIALFSPGNGVVEEVYFQIGDRVEEGEVLLQLKTQKTYAPWNGTVQGVKGTIGQDLQDVLNRYGAILFINPQEKMVIEGTTAQGYNEEENKIINPGEKVYLLSTATKDRKATGTITAVEGNGYKVEVNQEENSLNLNERVGIYRRDDHDGKSRIGYGLTARNPLIPIEGSGNLVALHVEEGQEVKQGDLLFETLPTTINGGRIISNEVISPKKGIITNVLTPQGTSVILDQLLLILVEEEELEVTATVGESDYAKVQQGDTVALTFEGYDEEKPVSGTISSVAAFSVTEKGEKEYTVKIDFSTNLSLPLGIEATAVIQP